MSRKERIYAEDWYLSCGRVMWLVAGCLAYSFRGAVHLGVTVSISLSHRFPHYEVLNQITCLL